MKNENSTARRERMQAERIEEDRRLAEAAATEATEQAERDRRAEEERLAAVAVNEHEGGTPSLETLEEEERGLHAVAVEKDRATAQDAERQAAADGPVMMESSGADDAERDERDTPTRFAQFGPEGDKVERDRLAKENETRPALPLWELRAKNREAPPFHFTNVAVRVLAAAASAEEARRIASGAAGEHGVSWLDDTQTDCVELSRAEPGLIAQDLGA